MPSPPPPVVRRTMREIARISLRETQPFRREVRRLLRHSSVRALLGAGESQSSLGWCINHFLNCTPYHLRQPVSMRRELETLIHDTLRSVDEGDVCPADFHDKCYALVMSFLCLQTGFFTGTQLHPVDSPGQCSICLYERDGGHCWWYSFMCGHCFHANCISNHLRVNRSCPLCRIEFLEC